MRRERGADQAGTKGQRMSKRKKAYLRVRLVESFDDGTSAVVATEFDGVRMRLLVVRKDLLIVTPNSNIVPWSPAKAKKKGAKK